MPAADAIVPSSVIGMLLFVASELMFFAGFISAFTISRAGARAVTWSVPGRRCCRPRDGGEHGGAVRERRPGLRGLAAVQPAVATRPSRTLLARLDARRRVRRPPGTGMVAAAQPGA